MVYNYLNGTLSTVTRTAVDGQTITYDPVGNPTSYYNGTRWTFTWEHGRNLGAANAGSTSLTFTYDADGIRTSKTVGGVVHTYYYAGGKLLRETYGTNTLDFFYDASGNAYAFKYNGTLYYYITNLQGDVMSIVDAQGTVVASYQYDPYGNVVSATGSMAEINPLRYRGYYYDSETGFYYLQSRYYDPELGRFLNADTYASTGQGLLGYNMFAYCGNNPINHYDPSGHAITAILAVIVPICIDAVIDGTLSALIEYATGGTSEDVLEAFFGGAVQSATLSVAGFWIPADDIDDFLKGYAIYKGVEAFDNCIQNGASYDEGLFVGVMTTLSNLPYSAIDDSTARKVAELVFGTGSDAVSSVLQKYFSGEYSDQAILPSISIELGPYLSGKGMGNGCGSSVILYSAFD